jgi:hypothetical protein
VATISSKRWRRDVWIGRKTTGDSPGDAVCG